ncbi:MAG: ornithine carbamoyltransferase [Deltaproteobacteria bacterium]|nr:ornithine carbamoyltransferase [Deltaproteobacteria bacterium]
MPVNLKGRHLLSMLHHTPQEIRFLLDLSRDLKQLKRAGTYPRNLEHRNIALLFEKPSTRTRCAFVVACVDEGAHPEYLGKSDLQLGKKETIADTARVLGRMFDGLQFRGFAHSTVEMLARHAGVPVWNGLTDLFHPTQALADLMTIEEKLGRLAGVRLTYLGDGRNNVSNSLLVAGAKMGMEVRIVAPEALWPEGELLAQVRRIAEETSASIVITSSVEEGVDGADVLYTDVWASMGEEAKAAERIVLLTPYRVDSRMIQLTGNPRVIFLHCLPAIHNTDTDASRETGAQEVTEEVFEGPHSQVFDQAENRLHTIKAVMVASLGR